MLKKYFALALCLIMALSVLAGCATTPATTPTEPTASGDPAAPAASTEPAAPAEPEVKLGPDGREVAAEQVYRKLYGSEVTTMNYLITGTTNDLTVGANTIDSLVENDQYANIVPGLAEKWEVSEDGLTWTFHLRQGTYWYDAAGQQQEEVTANDFVAALRYVCDAANDAGNFYMVDGWIVGATEYYDYTSALLEGETPEAVAAVEDIGVVAVDDYTLEYHLCIPRPYFDTALQYGPYWPASKTMLEQYGASYAIDNQSMWFNGAYILSTFEPQSSRVYTKNPGYWDAANVHIETIEETYNSEAATLAPEMFLRGEVDYAEISTDILDDWRNDPEKSQQVAPTRVTGDYSYFYAFNFEPRFDAEYEPDNWRIAVNNENFRQAIFHGLDRITAIQATYPENATELVQNCVTPVAFAVNAGKDYTSYGELAAIAARDSYDTAAAVEYMNKAKEELAAAGCTFPIKVLLPYNSSMSDWGNECVIVEQQLEGLFGADTIDIVISAYSGQSFLSDTRRAGNYALLKCNWGADYADPQTWTDPFVDGNTYNFAYDTTEKWEINTKGEEVAAIHAEYQRLVDLAKAEYFDMDKRYTAFAAAEAYYISHAMVIPYGITGGDFQASKLNVFEGQFATSGQSSLRYKGQYVYTTAMSTEMFEAQYNAWKGKLGID